MREQKPHVGFICRGMKETKKGGEGGGRKKDHSGGGRLPGVVSGGWAEEGRGRDEAERGSHSPRRHCVGGRHVGRE